MGLEHDVHISHEQLYYLHALKHVACYHAACERYSRHTYVYIILTWNYLAYANASTLLRFQPYTLRSKEYIQKVPVKSSRKHNPWPG